MSNACRECGRDVAASNREAVPNRCRAWMKHHLVGVEREIALDECDFAAMSRRAARYTDVKPFVDELQRWTFAPWFPVPVLFAIDSRNGLDVRVHMRAYVGDRLWGLDRSYLADAPSILTIEPGRAYIDMLREVLDAMFREGFTRS